ncbi:RICIN domain-containing protein [Dactylosporangium sp. NPDC000521]|uniref:RICIN domain-containing protein n=1 Tax=Dactylosporangium sp. NPDC000521 TaxID=3363975 RepID=UPI003695E7AF
MRQHRLATLLLAAAAAIIASLAVTPAAHAESPIVKLVSKANGKCLQPAGNAALDLIIQMPCTGVVAQQWTQESVNSTSFRLRNRASGLCMEVREGAFNGATVDQWLCTNITNVRWGYGISNDLLGSGISGSSSHCVATPGSQDGLPVGLRFCDGNSTQRWSHLPG